MPDFTDDAVGLWRRKANAWDYVIRRGYLGGGKIREAMEFGKLSAGSFVEPPGPDDVVVYRLPERDGNDRAFCEEIADQLRRAFPENRLVILLGDEGGLEFVTKEEALEHPAIAASWENLELELEKRKGES